MFEVFAMSSFYNVLLFMSVVLIQQNNGQHIKGIMERCNNEGERANVSIVSGNPCFTCHCRQGVVQCSKQICPGKYLCSMLTHESQRCCSSCLICTNNGVIYEHNERWQILESKNGECYDHVCHDGIVTRFKMTCHVPCSQPIITKKGNCNCPSCVGCRYNEEIIAEGMTKNVDECITCKCKDSNMECKRHICPILACDSNERIKDGCCYKCKGQRKVSKLKDSKCWFSRRILNNRELLKINNCVSCTCLDGTVLCNKIVCEETLPCPHAEWMQHNDDCCPRCPPDISTNCIDWQGNNIQDGHVWKEKNDTCLNCKCSNGYILCQRDKCDTYHICPTGQILENVPGKCCASCVQEPGVCVVFGDPHYRTFDGRPFNFQGEYRYMLAKDCSEKKFSVVVQNVAKRLKHFSWTNSIQLTLKYQGNTTGKIIVATLHQHLVLRVNKRKVALPFISENILAWVEHRILKLRTSAGVSLNWDGDSFLEVEVSSQYIGKLCGLCGNFNGFARDDFIGGDGLFKFNDENFARSWEIGKENRKFSIKKLNEKLCDGNQIKRNLSRKKCQIFKSKTFQTCFAAVDPKQYYDSCSADTCVCPRHRKCACESARAYTKACERKGIKLKWNEKSHCKETCERNKIYLMCGSPCNINCKNYKRMRKRDACRRTCTAGCFCPAGSVLKGKRCAKISTCSGSRVKQFKQKFKDVNPFKHFLTAQDSNGKLVLEKESGKQIENVYIV